MSRLLGHRRAGRGQTLVELALVLPLFLMVLFGIVILGIGVFYQQQLTHAAREAARYAAVHSATAIDPVVSTRVVNPSVPVSTNNPVAVDQPNSWPNMTQAARNATFGLDRSAIHVTACWSGFWQVDHSTSAIMPDTWDAGPTNGSGDSNAFLHCSLPASGGVNIDPRTGLSDGDPSLPGAQPGGTQGDLPCTDPMPATGMSNDTASNLAWSQYPSGNEVTVYACYVWNPPLAGFLLIPDSVTMRAVISEAMQHQK